VHQVCSISSSHLTLNQAARTNTIKRLALNTATRFHWILNTSNYQLHNTLILQACASYINACFSSHVWHRLNILIDGKYTAPITMHGEYCTNSLANTDPVFRLLLQWSGGHTSLHLPQLLPVIIFINLVWRWRQTWAQAAAWSTWHIHSINWSQLITDCCCQLMFNLFMSHSYTWKLKIIVNLVVSVQKNTR